MPRALSLDKSLGTSTATRLHFVVNDKVPDPTRRADSFDSLDDLTAQLPPGDAAAVIDFVDAAKPLPFDVLNRLRDQFTAGQLAALIGVDKPQVIPMTIERTTAPVATPIWRISDSVWREAEQLLDRLNPPRASATARMDQRKVVDAIVNRALTGLSYAKLAQLGNEITLRQSADRLYERDAYKPLVALLLARCPELNDCDWSRPLSRPLAARFSGRPEEPKPKRHRGEREAAVRAARQGESSGNLAARFGVKIEPTPLGQVVVGDLSVRLLFDPRPASEVAPATHTYGDDQRIVFASTAGVADIGRAISQHLQRSLDRRVGKPAEGDR